MNVVLAMVGCLLFIITVLVMAVLFIWWYLPCAKGD